MRTKIPATRTTIKRNRRPYLARIVRTVAGGLICSMSLWIKYSGETAISRTRT